MQEETDRKNFLIESEKDLLWVLCSSQKLHTVHLLSYLQESYQISSLSSYLLLSAPIHCIVSIQEEFSCIECLSLKVLLCPKQPFCWVARSSCLLSMGFFWSTTFKVTFTIQLGLKPHKWLHLLRSQVLMWKCKGRHLVRRLPSGEQPQPTTSPDLHPLSRPWVAGRHQGDCKVQIFTYSCCWKTKLTTATKFSWKTIINGQNLSVALVSPSPSAKSPFPSFRHLSLGWTIPQNNSEANQFLDALASLDFTLVSE